MRVSIVNAIKIDNVGLSSTLFVGDNLLIHPKSYVVAVQQKYPTYLHDVNEFAAPIFHYPIHIYRDPEVVRTSIRNESPVIKVDRIKIIAASVSAVVQIGSTGAIRAQTRLKHARRILD